MKSEKRARSAQAPDDIYTLRKNSQLKEIAGRLFKNRIAVLGLVILTVLILVAIFADQIAPYGYDDQLLSRKFLLPCPEHIMGTDNFGRDIFSRVVYGSRISLQVGLISMGFAIIAGCLVGSVAGYYSGLVDNLIMRIVDIMLAIPSILLAISIAAALGPGLQNLMIAISIGSVPQFARIVRASILTVKEQEYIEAARAIGASDARIIISHILPNCIAPIIVQATLGVGNAILSAAGLSFIGLGVRPPVPEWGTMLSAGRQYIRDFWPMLVFPGLAIMLTVFSLNVLGDGLRDALDPRLKS